MTALARTTPAGQCDEKTARRLTNEIKKSLELSHRLVHEAFARQAWVALHYSSWAEYCREEFGSGLRRLAKELRREAVAELASGENPMSNRAIAAAFGVDEGTVRNDRKALAGGAESSVPAHELETEAEAAPGFEVVDAEVVDEHQTEPEPEDTRPQRRVVRGADGKNYVAPVRDVPPPAPRKRGGGRTHRQVLEAMTASLSGIATVLDDITNLDGSMTRDEAAKFARDLDQQIPALDRVRNLLEKYVEVAYRAAAAERGDVG